MKRNLTCAAAVAMVAWASAAMAGNGSYTGNWHVELTQYEYPNNNGWNHGSNTSHCLALTDDGSAGYTHSGFVMEDGQYYGQFQVIGRTIMIIVQAPGGEGEIATRVYSSLASDGTITNKGAFNYDEGESYGAALATFSKRDIC
jgi:hypothetical protein